MYQYSLSIVRLVITLLSRHRYSIIRILFLLTTRYLKLKSNICYMENQSLYLIFSAILRTISSCDGSVRFGSVVSVDMNKIGRPCTCTVNSLFVGDLLVHVTSLIDTTSLCNTRVIVNSTVVFYCNKVASSTYKVEVNDILIVRAENMAGNNKNSFNQCVIFSENGNFIQFPVYLIN